MNKSRRGFLTGLLTSVISVSVLPLIPAPAAANRLGRNRIINGDMVVSSKPSLGNFSTWIKSHDTGEFGLQLNVPGKEEPVFMRYNINTPNKWTKISGPIENNVMMKSVEEELPEVVPPHGMINNTPYILDTAPVVAFADIDRWRS